MQKVWKILGSNRICLLHVPSVRIDLYANTKAGDLLTKSHPETMIALPGWRKYYSDELDKLEDKIKVSESEKEKEQGKKSGKTCVSMHSIV